MGEALRATHNEVLRVTKGRGLRIWHSHVDAAPECDPRHPRRSATSVTVSEPVNTRRPVSALAITTFGPLTSNDSGPSTCSFCSDCPCQASVLRCYARRDSVVRHL